MKISVLGAGYVGIGAAMPFLSNGHMVAFYDINEDVRNLLNKGISPIKDERTEYIIDEYKKNITALDSLEAAIKDAAYCFICVPTPLNEATRKLDVSIVDLLLNEISKIEKKPQIFIRSTLNIEDGDLFEKKYPELDIVVMPEFLREKFLFDDTFKPSRIILGISSKKSRSTYFEFTHEYTEGLFNTRDVNILETSYKEASMIKLFSNAYLATRVAFFNEVDSLASYYGVDSRTIRRGMGLDPRIGNYYNFPSNGFGGKCLPKDLVAASTAIHDANFGGCILDAVEESNEARKKNSK